MAPEQNDEVRRMVEEIAKALVDHPEQVSVEAAEDSQNTAFKLRVAEGEVGKVIGRQGRTARSMRSILTVAGQKLHRRFTLEIVE